MAVFRTRLRSRDRFTILTSSILTGATFIDSGIKRRKREKLLGAIKEAQDELKALDTSQKSRLAALSTDHGEIKELASSGKWTWDDVLKWAEKETHARHCLGFKDWKGIPLRILEGLSTSHLEDAFRNNSVLRKLLFGVDSRAVTRPVPSMKKKKILEWSTAKLAQRLVQESYQRNASSDNLSVEVGNVSSGPEELQRAITEKIVQADTMIAQIRKLPPHSEAVEEQLPPKAPRYFPNFQSHEQNITMLNASLEKGFQLYRTQRGSLQRLMRVICHHLLVSNAPPSIQTYTLLARNFAQMGNHELVKVVLSAIQECKCRLDEEALSFWLDYYATQNNLEHFQELLSRMHGFGDGLCLAHLNNVVAGISFNQYRLGHSEGPRSCTVFDNEFLALKYRDLEFMVLRKARKDQAVYSSLIRGTLKLIGDEKAMVHYIDMIQEGHQPTAEILTSILDQCSSNKHWNSALSVVQKYHDLAGANLQTYYRWSLRIYQNLQDRQRFKKVLEGGIRRGIISSAVQYFPKQIHAMRADELLDLAGDYDDLIRWAGDTKQINEPPEKVERWLGLIAYQMAEMAYNFASFILSAGYSPSKTNFLYTKIMYHRAVLLDWAKGGGNMCSKVAHDDPRTSPEAPRSLKGTKKRVHKGSNNFDGSSFSNTMPVSNSYFPVHSRGRCTSLWDPILRRLVSEFLKMKLLLEKFIRELADIEFSVQQGAKAGQMLHPKMVFLAKRPLKSTTLKLPTRPKRILLRSSGSAAPTLQDLTSDVLRSEEKGKVLSGEYRLQGWDLNRKPGSEVRWGALNLEKSLQGVTEQEDCLLE